MFLLCAEGKVQLFACLVSLCLAKVAVSDHDSQVVDQGTATCLRTGMEEQSWNWEERDCR